MKNIVTIMGSPHKNGNIATALNQIKIGIEKNSTDINIKTYNLAEKNIKNCIGCRKCVFNGGNCILKDDFDEIFETIKSSDMLIIGAPIYICQVNGIVKTFLDRLYPLATEKHKPRFGKKSLITLYTYGAPIPFIFNKYIKYNNKSLKAMGLIGKKNINIHGCTTINKVKNDYRKLNKLENFGHGLLKFL